MTDEQTATPPETAPVLPESLELTINGQVYKLGRVGFLAKLEAEPEIRGMRRAEFRMLVKDMEDIQSAAAARAISAGFDNYMRNVSVTHYDIVDFFGSPTGTLFLLHRSLQVFKPDATAEQAKFIFSGATADQFDQVDKFLRSCIRA